MRHAHKNSETPSVGQRVFPALMRKLADIIDDVNSESIDDGMGKGPQRATADESPYEYEGVGLHVVPPPAKAQKPRSVVLPLQVSKEETRQDGAIVLMGRPQVTFRARKLYLDLGEHKDRAYIKDIQIGKNSQYAADGPVPAKFFIDKEIDLYFDVAQISMHVSVIIGGLPEGFVPTGMFIGDSID